MLKIGKTHFRNTEFIYYGFENPNSNFEFVTAHPPKLGEMVVKGELDIAPASSIIYAKHPDNLLILPNFSINALGKTMSILVFSKKFSSLEELNGKKLALPLTSASSNALVEILLRMKKLNTELICNQVPKVDIMLKNADAGLLIGDDALHALSNGNRVLADLGEEWFNISGKNMVYALWLINKETTRYKGNEVKEFLQELTRARTYAYKNIDIVTKNIASQVSMDYNLLRKHLSHLSYNLGDEEINGLLKYFKYAKTVGIIDKVPDLNFFLE